MDGKVCPICERGTLRAHRETVTRLGVELEVIGERCSACGETLVSNDEATRQELALAAGLVARGVRAGNEFKLVRKAAGLMATEVAELLDVRPETVSRWERGEVEIPRAVAFALGELYDRPRVTRQKFEAFAR